MQIDPLDRIGAPSRGGGGRRLLIGVLTLLGFAVLALALVPELRDYARRGYASTGLPGADSADRFSALYRRLNVPPLPTALEVSADIGPKLERLAQSPCDKTAVYGLAEALVKVGETRDAAQIYTGFAASCPNGVGEEHRAAQLFLFVGEYDKALGLIDHVIAVTPGVANHHYLRGQAYAALRRYEEALADYKKLIELSPEPIKLNESVFTDMAKTYVALGRPCDAAATILAWIALDPVKRNTPNEQKVAREYAARGCRANGAPADSGRL